MVKEVEKGVAPGLSIYFYHCICLSDYGIFSKLFYLFAMCIKCGCRHQSKFRRLVQDDAVKNKAAYRTMGPAKVQTKPPDQFLKKHEKDPKMPQSELSIFLFIFGFTVSHYI